MTEYSLDGLENQVKVNSCLLGYNTIKGRGRLWPVVDELVWLLVFGWFLCCCWIKISFKAHFYAILLKERRIRS